MAKRLAIERITRQDGAAQAASGPTAQSPFPLAEEPMQRPKLILLTARYLVSLAGSGYSITETLGKLRENTHDELVVTSQVMDELEGLASPANRKMDGSPALEPARLAEIKCLIGSGLLHKEEVRITEQERREAGRYFGAGSQGGQRRIQDSELSLFVLARQMVEVYDADAMQASEATAPGKPGEPKKGAEEKSEPSVEDLRGFSDAQVIQVFGRLAYGSKGRGDTHWIMCHRISGKSASIPKHRDINPRTLDGILKQNGISRRAFLKAAQDAGLISKKRAREIFGEAEAKPGQKKDPEGEQPAQSA